MMDVYFSRWDVLSTFLIFGFGKGIFSIPQSFLVQPITTPDFYSDESNDIWHLLWGTSVHPPSKGDVDVDPWVRMGFPQRSMSMAVVVVHHIRISYLTVN